MSVYKVTSELLDEGAQVLTKTAGHQFLIDEPVSSHGTDKAPNPVEYLLGSLGGCLAITIKDQAHKRHISLSHVTVAVSGDLEMGGLRDPKIHNQFTDIVYHVAMTSDLSAAQQDQFLNDCVALCPVHGTLTTEVPVHGGMVSAISE
ncbi:OsmC family protein [Agrilactobacillus yilanensis]|uniref:OsmC family protein n=1 Tax=Agrilactobacillus yilanensis TaxID=2485997 RepID=A0ABW4J803_9LACO|nr:OsmC family protein [Agrilactobacillus yilanensis]